MNVDLVQARYDDLDVIAANFGQWAEANKALGNKLDATVANLTSAGWVGQGSHAFYAEMDSDIVPAMQRLTAALDEASSLTIKIKVVIQQAEEEASALFSGEIEGIASLSSLAGLIDSLLNDSATITEWISCLKGFAALPAALALATTIRNGVVSISGQGWLANMLGLAPHQVKELAGLSPYLTRIKPENLPGHMAKYGGALSLLNLLPVWFRDLRDYRQDGLPTLGAALAVDTAVTGTVSYVTGYTGYWAGGAAILGGAALLGLTAPVWAVVAGGVAGGIVLGAVGNTVLDWWQSSNQRTDLIDNTAEGFQIIGDTVSGAARQTVQVVDNTIRSSVEAVQQISSLRLATKF